MLTPDADRTDETHSNIDSTIFLALAPVTGLSLSVPRLDSALASEWHAGYGHHTHTMQMHTPRPAVSERQLAASSHMRYCHGYSARAHERFSHPICDHPC